MRLPLSSLKVFTVSEGDESGFELILRMIDAQILTGHNSLSLDLCCIIVSFFVSLFCSSKVIETQSDEDRSGSEWEICLLPRKKRVFFNRSSLVFLGP